MRETARKLGYVLVALLGAIALTFTSAVAWAATTVLVVPGTGTKDPSKVEGYQENVVGYYVAPTGACGATDCIAKPVPYIAEFWPIPLSGWGGLQGAKWDDSVASGVTSLNEQYAAADKDSPIVIFGYSQGGTVVTAVKKQLAENGGVPDNVSFVLIGNASRPNGGLFTRPSFLGHIPILDVTFGTGTPTNTGTGTRPVNTTDVGFQYDGVTDFPKYPANLLATANALAGFWYVHGKMLAPKGSDDPSATPIGYTPDEVRAAVEAATANCTAGTYCQVSGDTRYVTLPAKILPIMLPLLDLGKATGTTALFTPFIDLVSPVARVLIETGYDRRDYGAVSPFGIVPLLDPLRLGTDLLGAAVQGIGQAATGTGDASRFLTPKPATSATTGDAEPSRTSDPTPAAPSTPQPTKEQSPVLQLVETAVPQPDPSPSTQPSPTTGQSSTVEPSATPEPSAKQEPSATQEPATSATPESPAATGTVEPAPAGAATATESKPATDSTGTASDEPVVAAAAA
ncbi:MULTISPECIES: PE-PPE domain-containing protein [Tsukamurella]|uniref:PE-PPE domain-containing protein n=2 Tax=Tsukamurella TaxID=2060 RepID=A0A5C5RY62_9ACTN|nr:MULTISPECIES: PE-PPE domain-containing protein [Tsukamurella]NMD56638.1 PE-PPE domain-containing protein [Tsukamurella columbiensis]TWS27438.1 PE-PPE domain-containing protein [Tsukamurella conjunctivitidis]